MARTTVDLDPQLLAELKHIAAEARESMSRTLNRLLRLALGRCREPGKARGKFRWNVVPGGRPVEGFNPATRDYLDLLDDTR